MKKEFMEPEMKRIELNLKERIATSAVSDIVQGAYITWNFGSEGVPCSDPIYQSSSVHAYTGNLLSDLAAAGITSIDEAQIVLQGCEANSAAAAALMSSMKNGL